MECIVRKITQKTFYPLYSDMMIRNMKVTWKFQVVIEIERKRRFVI
jgi:hypothetical protein